MTLNLEQRKDELEKEIAAVNEELKNGKGNSEELHERIKNWIMIFRKSWIIWRTNKLNWNMPMNSWMS